MIRTLTLATALAAVIALPAMAEDAKVPAAAITSVQAPKAGDMPLTSQEANAWIGKPVYSSDDKKLGEVEIFQRSTDGKVTGMFADIGGYWGIGQHRVKVASAQLSLKTDRVILDLTAAQAKELPAIAK
jgi:PRC-barrel domain